MMSCFCTCSVSVISNPNLTSFFVLMKICGIQSIVGAHSAPVKLYLGCSLWPPGVRNISQSYVSEFCIWLLYATLGTFLMWPASRTSEERTKHKLQDHPLFRQGWATFWQNLTIRTGKSSWAVLAVSPIGQNHFQGWWNISKAALLFWKGNIHRALEHAMVKIPLKKHLSNHFVH